MTISFKTTLLKDPGGNATGLRVPDEVMAQLNAGKKPRLKVTLNGSFSYVMTVGTVSGMPMISLSAANREAAGLKAGDPVEVAVELDTAPRTVEIPDDLAAALAAKPGARAAFDAASFTVRKEFVRQVNEAKAADTRARRIAKIVDQLGG
ncbi:MAG TPA: YdeI/OmpD-associated family protein [Phototrophicaceae bacterium]|nr:YdeI/OmpD-associated family protein [Phototrophicaceae bacterium]